jgi:hypothetical protein
VTRAEMARDPKLQSYMQQKLINLEAMGSKAETKRIEFDEALRE